MPIRKYNILIGSSAMGKSTLAKVICNAEWVEKELVVSRGKRPGGGQDDGTTYVANLTVYHHLESYLQPDTRIAYEGDYVSFVFQNASPKPTFSYTLRDTLHNFQRLKTLYIPAERNVVAVIPNWFDIKLPQNNLRGYLSAWEEARKYYTSEHPLPLPLFDANYYTSQDGSKDIISFCQDKVMTLGEVASGIQTSVPLSLLLGYFGKPNQTKNLISISDQRNQDDVKSFALSSEYGEKLMSLSKKEKLSANDKETLMESMNQLTNLISIKGTSFFIEEPELNLFPKLQYELFEGIIKVINEVASNALTITTHSPYILAFLSNYIYAHELQHKMGIEVSDIVPPELMIPQESVSAYLLTEGTATNILSDDYSLGIDIKDLDAVSKEIGSTWDELVQREVNR